MVSISIFCRVASFCFTEIFGSPFECNDARWNGLKVELYAGEKVVYDPAEATNAEKEMEDYFSTHGDG